MANVTLTIPDGQLNRVVDAFAIAYKYSSTLPDPAIPGATIPNPETRAQFMRRCIMEFLRNTVQSVEAGVASEVARTAEMAKPTVSVT